MGYEKVTPDEKGDANIWLATGLARSSASGDRVTFRVAAGLAGTPSNNFPTDYQSVRSGGRWSTLPLNPAQDIDESAASGGDRRGVQGFSEDLTRGVLIQRDPALALGAAPGVRNFYVANLEGGTPSYDLVTPPPLLSPTPWQAEPALAAVRDGGARLVYESTLQLTADATPGVANVYEWVDGRTRLVSVLPNGTPAVASSAVGRGAQPRALYNLQYATDQAVSRDGSRIVFTVADGAQSSGYRGKIYVRIDGAETREISAPAPGVPVGTEPAKYEMATPDGSVVFFTSCERLTLDSTATCASPQKRDLYRYSVDSGRLEDLTSDSSAPTVEGVVGTDDAGEYAYIASGTPTQLYLVHGGEIDPIVGHEGDALQELNFGDGIQRQSAVSADGRFMVYAAVRSTDPFVSDLWFFDAHSQTVKCMSCDPNGRASFGRATLRVRETSEAEGFTAGQLSANPATVRTFDASMKRVVFNARNGLVAQDTNGRTDVYQMNLATGEVDLISTGAGDSPAFYVDADTDGSTVFFATANQVIRGLDRDALMDIYVARHGATPYVPPVNGDCAGSACQGPLGTPPGESSPGTSTFSGPDDLEEAEQPVRARVLQVLPLGARARSRWASTGRVTITVRASEPGRLSARATARIGNRARTVATARKTIRDGGTTRMVLSLTRTARERLRARRRLSLRVSVRYAGGEGDSTTVTLVTRKASRK